MDNPVNAVRADGTQTGELNRYREAVRVILAMPVPPEFVRIRPRNLRHGQISGESRINQRGTNPWGRPPSRGRLRLRHHPRPIRHLRSRRRLPPTVLRKNSSSRAAERVEVVDKTREGLLMVSLLPYPH